MLTTFTNVLYASLTAAAFGEHLFSMMKVPGTKAALKRCPDDRAGSCLCPLG
jgi:hypothetical protein